jgi:GH15 family glucan-1,4-alpha-glucosidase
MYGLAGERRLDEWIVDWLPGYAGSRPVRIGNAAAGQFQLDTYGEVIDALHHARKGGLDSDPGTWAIERVMLEHVAAVWADPDQGIWEMRRGPRHFTYSKVMAWVAFDRSIKSAERFNLDGPVDRWRKVCKEIHADVCRYGVDQERGIFVRAYGSRHLDASLLLLPAVGFLPPSDPRIRATVEAIERDLTVDGLVRRYDTVKSEDGLPPGEGLFLACSFWLVDAYLLIGRADDARRLFDRLLALRNDVGLLSEEYEPRTGRLVGNFPQAFSHLALVNTASNLSHYKKPAEQRSEARVDDKPDMRIPAR